MGQVVIQEYTATTTVDSPSVAGSAVTEGISPSTTQDSDETNKKSVTITCQLKWHVYKYPTMHYSGIPRHTQSMIAY